MERALKPPLRWLVIVIMILATLAILWVWFFAGMGQAPKVPAPPTEQTRSYALHEDIRATMFWAGEDADESNQFIDNRASTWTLNWTGAYGGIDSPDKRCGYLPCGFTPKENPFYFALPYSDLADDCSTKDSQKQVPWYMGETPHGQSIVKNRWVEVHFKDKIVYAQWEDAGPAGEDDTAYVFGTARPQYMYGIDLSPAANTYLGTDGDDPVSWRFVPDSAVPAGPWKNTVTTSPPDCAL